MTRKILFYDDAAFFGGHEAMALRYVDRLAADPENVVLFAFSEDNVVLAEALARLGSAASVQVIPVAGAAPSPQGLRTLVSPLRVRAVWRMVREARPDVVVVIQGNIEVGSLALVAAKLAGVPLVSYIPLAHSMKEFGARFASLRDAIHSLYYRLPDRFITISAGQQRKLAERGVPPDRVRVVPNFVGEEAAGANAPSEARRLGLPPDRRIVGLLGRIHFRHKRQDFLVREVARYRAELEGFHFLIVGNGPDETALGRLVSRYGVGDMVTCTPWIDDAARAYAPLHAVVIPSAFEGVPLVMLEAVRRGLPVVGSRVDGMAEHLPEPWLFDAGSGRGMVDALRALSWSGARIRDVRREFTRRFDREASGGAFADALTTLAGAEGGCA